MKKNGYQLLARGFLAAVNLAAAAVLAAGDSAFDLPMLTAADFAAAPAQCGWKGLPCHVQVMPGKKVFSEELLEAMQRYLLHIL